MIKVILFSVKAWVDDSEKSWVDELCVPDSNEGNNFFQVPIRREMAKI